MLQEAAHTGLDRVMLLQENGQYPFPVGHVSTVAAPSTVGSLANSRLPEGPQLLGRGLSSLSIFHTWMPPPPSPAAAHLRC
jgi:hypothetical protein